MQNTSLSLGAALVIPAFFFGAFFLDEGPENKANTPERPLIRTTDINADGLTDLILTESGQVRLLINLGEDQYADQTLERGLFLSEIIAFQDLDGDGSKEIFGKGPQGNFLLYQNNEEKTAFENITLEAGLTGIQGEFLALRDITQDGRADFLFQGEAGTYLWKRNEKELHFQPIPLFIAPEKLAVEEELSGEATAETNAENGKAAQTFPPGTPGPRTGVQPINTQYVITGCNTSLEDQAGGSCLEASSTPQLGMLYPLSNDFFVAPDGKVSLGTTSPGAARFYVTNADTGIMAGQFINSNAASGKVALRASTAGTNAALYALNTGTGRALKAQISNAANSDHAVYGQTNGSGSAFFAWQTGSGPAATFKVVQASNTSDALVVTTAGSGKAANLGGPLHVTDNDNAPAADIAEFFASNGNQGIGIGYNRIEAIGANANQDIHFKTKGTGTLYLDADSIVNGTTTTDVLTITGGSDLAEPFHIKEDVQPGMVVCIDPEEPGKLKLSTKAYDRTVAGVVSGAGGVNAGLTLRQEGKFEGGTNIALAGRAYVWCEGPIEPGDLLTTSRVPGHAMKAQYNSMSFGAIIGKALTPLEKGRGLVLMVVTLQ